MRVHLDMDWLLKALLISVRLATMLWASPLLSLGRVPLKVKLFAVLAFSAALGAILPQMPAGALTPATLMLATVNEMIAGALMAFGLYCAFGAFQLGGRLLDMQMGFGIANLISPSSDEQEPLLGTALLVTGVMTFYLVDAHHWLARGVVQSYEWLPMGTFPREIALEALVAQFGLMFTLGVALVMPVVAILLLLDVGLAMAAKTMPQLNVFMLSIPVKILIGLVMLAACAPYIGWAMRRVLESIFHFWGALAA